MPDVEATLDAVLADEARAGSRADDHTLGGLVLAWLGHLPHEGEAFVASGLRFELVAMDGRRIDRALIAPARGAAP